MKSSERNYSATQRHHNFMLVEGAAQNDLTKVEAALDLKADIDCSYQGFTPLYFAAMKGNAKVIHCLLRNGARTETICNKRRTAIMIAASRGRLRTVKLLLEHGANVHRKDESGATAQYLALRNGHEAVADLLKSYGESTLPRETLIMNKLRISK